MSAKTPKFIRLSVGPVHLGTLGNGAVAGDHDIDVPGGLAQPVECRLVGAPSYIPQVVE